MSGGVDLYRDAAEVYGHPDALLAKVYWDNFSYWSYPCQLYIQKLYALTGDEMGQMIPLGERFAGMTKNLQRLFTAWAKLTPSSSRPGFRGMPGFPTVLIDAHLALQNKWSPEVTFDYIAMRLVQAEEMAGELLLRAMDEVGPEHAETLVEMSGAKDWDIQISDARVKATATVGLARRRALEPLARDVERTLGRTPHNIDEATIRRVLGAVIDAPIPEDSAASSTDPSMGGSETTGAPL